MFPYYGCTYLNTVKSIELYILSVNSMAWVISQYIHFSKEKLKIKNLVYLYECMPVGVHATCVGHLQRPEKVTGSLGTGFTGGYELPVLMSGTEFVPSENQQVFLTAKPSF